MNAWRVTKNTWIKQRRQIATEIRLSFWRMKVSFIPCYKINWFWLISEWSIDWKWFQRVRVYYNFSWCYVDSLDVDLYGDLLAVDLNQEMTYPEVKTNGWFSIILLNLLSLSSLQWLDYGDSSEAYFSAACGPRFKLKSWFACHNSTITSLIPLL